jgi:hypothetical protein
MATKSYTKGVGQRSKKRTGYVVQSIRLLAPENKQLHVAAKEAGISFNGWAVNILKREAAKSIKRIEAAKPKKVSE